MSTDLTVGLQYQGEAKPNSDFVIAAIWLVFYLLVGIRALLVNQNGPAVLLATFAAVLGGWGVLGWRRKKKTDHTMKSLNLFAGAFASALTFTSGIGLVGSANANTVDVSYTISGSPGAWTYNFSVTNNINVAQNVYVFAVLTPGTVSASPTNWLDLSSSATALDLEIKAAGASSTAYNNWWIVSDLTGPDTISPTHSLSGFEVNDTSSVPLTTLPFVASEVSSTLDHGLKFLGGDCFNCVVNCHDTDCGWNPGFEGTAVGTLAVSGVPGPVAGAGLPGLVFACGSLFAWWRRKRKGATAIAAA